MSLGWSQRYRCQDKWHGSNNASEVGTDDGTAKTFLFKDFVTRWCYCAYSCSCLVFSGSWRDADLILTKFNLPTAKKYLLTFYLSGSTLTRTSVTARAAAGTCVACAAVRQAKPATRRTGSSIPSSLGVCHTPATATTTGPASTDVCSGTAFSPPPSPTQNPWGNRLAWLEPHMWRSVGGGGGGGRGSEKNKGLAFGSRSCRFCLSSLCLDMWGKKEILSACILQFQIKMAVAMRIKL